MIRALCLTCIVVGCAGTLDSYDAADSSTTAHHNDYEELSGLSQQEASLHLFEKHVMPELVMCASCHASNQAPYFASTEVEQAHQAIIDGNKVDFDNVTNSRLVLRLTEDRHNCGDDCDANGQKLLDALTLWQEGMAKATEQITGKGLRTIGHSLGKREVYYDIGSLIGEEYDGGYIMMIATITPLGDTDGGVSLSKLRVSAHEHVIYLKGVKPLIDGEWKSINAIFAPKGCGLLSPGGGVPRGKDTTVAFTPEEGEEPELSFEFADLRVVEDGEKLTLCSGEEIVVGEEEEEEEEQPSPPPPRRTPPPDPPEPVVVSPQEKAYDDNVDNVRTTLTSRCASCHGYMDNFNGIWNKRTQVKNRISRAAGADGVMPQNSRLAQEQIDAIVKWLDM